MSSLEWLRAPSSPPNLQEKRRLRAPFLRSRRGIVLPPGTLGQLRASPAPRRLAARSPGKGSPMDTPSTQSPLTPGAQHGLLDVLIRAGLILALAVLCFQVFAPFLHLMVWAVIL